ncbi:MAG: tetratricopeptide repeat protein [Anaerolineae bacterium]|nr:tetratricopeptide repeat protein [Anaerolineae bacterium]
MAIRTQLHDLVSEHLRLAESYRYLARHADAIRVLDGARTLTQLPDGSPADTNLLNIKSAELRTEGGWLHNRLDQELAELEVILNAARQDADQRGDKSQIAMAMMALGRLYYFYLFVAATQEIDRAEICLIEAHQRFAEVGDGAGQADALFFRGLIYQIFQPNPERAMSLFRQALELIEGQGLDVLKSYIVRHIGFLHLNAGELDAARDYLGQSLALRESADFRVFLPMAQIAFAEVLAQQGEQAQALDYLQQALTVAQEAPDNRLVMVLMAFGEHYEKSDPMQAYHYYEQARDMARTIGSARFLAMTEAKLKELKPQA